MNTERTNENESKRGTDSGDRAERGGPRQQGLGGILSGLAELLGSVGDLAERGEQIKRTGGFESPSGKQGSFQVGFNVRTASGGRPSNGADDGAARYTVEPFGHVRRDESTGKPWVDDVREPPVDVFVEDDCILVVAEMPGVTTDDVKVGLTGRGLDIEAARGAQRFAKHIELPEEPAGEPDVASNNGVFEIRFARSG